MPNQVFVSYARVDDEIDGWVTNLVSELQRRVNAHVGKRDAVHFKMDLQLNGHESLAEQIREAIQNSTIFLMVASNGFLASDWCSNTELPQFLESQSRTNVFVVEKMPYRRDRLPHLLSQRLGKIFWEEDRALGEWRTFGEPVATSVRDPKYQAVINRLSQEIANLVLQESQAEEADASETKPAVYLAEASDDLEEDRDAVRSYLLQQKIRVFTSESFPNEPEAYRSALKGILRRAGIIFAQLLSGSRGRRLVDGDEDTRCVPLQAAVAEGQRVQICQWRRRSLDLEQVKDPGYRKLLERDTVQASSLEDYKALLVARASAPLARVVVSRDENVDDSLANEIRRELKEMSLTADFISVSDKPDDLNKRLADCEALLLVYGGVSKAALEVHFKNCVRAIVRRIKPPPLRALVLGPPAPPPLKEPFVTHFTDSDEINCERGFDANRFRLYFETMPRPEQ